MLVALILSWPHYHFNSLSTFIIYKFKSDIIQYGVIIIHKLYIST